MKKPVIITIIAVALALAIGITAFAVSSGAGSSDDPLVSQSYVEGEYSSMLMAAATAPIDADLREVYTAAIEGYETAADNTTRRVVTPGGTITLAEGASITMVSGRAELVVSAGTVSDVTDGAAAASAAMELSHRYIAGPAAAATVSVTERAAFICSGAVTVTGGEVATVSFKDVQPSDWFYNDVAYTVGLGLIDGMNADTFGPNGQLTLAQAIKLAAVIHQLNTEGTVTLEPDDNIWYMSFVTYAMSNGILDASYAGRTTTEYNSPITRREFVHIYYNSLPESNYTEINSVADGAVPDVSMSATYAGEIYAFYRAGILVGDAQHNFNPGDNIRRSEVAAITARMMDISLRQAVTLG